MSCLCPIRIPDKVARDYGFQGAEMVVPCGHCAGCAKDRRNDWFVRIWSTYQQCKAERKPVWFVTVTIDPSLWPDLRVDSPGVGSRITPFVRSWTERFRYLNGGKMPLRFLCSEFGEVGRRYVDRNGIVRVTTGALHFHGVIFGWLPIKKLVSGFEQTHGHVDFDLIRGPEAIRYVVKYSTKDYSIEDPLLRARTFCSPGIGDSTYYFGDGVPTATVLINGYHYRTPRYFIDKQLLRIYGKSSYYDSTGRSLYVKWNFDRRLVEFRRLRDYISTLRTADSSFRDYAFCRLEINAKKTASLDQVNLLLAQGLTGPSHPLLRQKFRSDSYRRYVDFLTGDDSFNNYVPLIKTFNNQFYERDQIVFPLSFNFET